MKLAKKLKRSSKIIILVEIVLIFLFITLTIVEIIYTLNLEKHQENNKDKYFNYVLHIFVQDYIFTDLKVISKSQNCEKGYHSIIHYSIEEIENAKLVDITNETSIKKSDNVYYNNTFEGWKFYKFDLREKGWTDVKLLHRYDFDILEGKRFCYLRLNFDDDYESIQIIPSEETCKDFFPSNKPVECGRYSDEKYRMCVLVDKMTFDNGTSAIHALDNHPDEFFCPTNHLSFKFHKKDPDTNFRKFDWKVIKKNQPYKDYKKDGALMFSFYPFIYTSNSYDMKNPEQDYPYSLEGNKNIYPVGEKFGFTTPHARKIYETNFVDFYNDTMFHNNIEHVELGGTTKNYLPQFLMDENAKIFYLPVDNEEKTDPYKVKLATLDFPVIPYDCFQKIFLKNKIYAIFSFFSRLSFSIYKETYSTLLAWLFSKLFIALWCYFKIRFFILLDKLKIQLPEKDLESELITKYTFKVCSGVCLIITLFAVNYNDESLDLITNWGEDLVANKCFNEFLLENIKAYLVFIEGLTSYNDTVMICNYFSLAIECFILGLYIVWDFTDNKPIEIDHSQENQALVKEEKVKIA